MTLPPLKLRRMIKVHTLTIVGTLARPSSRTIFGPILEQLATDGESHAGRIADVLLFDPHSRRPAAERWLRMAEKLELVAETHRGHYRLTPTGTQAHERGEVFLPEHGVWEVEVSDDPLLPHPILAIRRSNSSRSRSRNGQKLRPLPSALTRLTGLDTDRRIVDPLLGSDTPWRVDELAVMAEWTSEIRLALEWSPVKQTLRMAGRANGRDIDQPVRAPDVEAAEVWHSLLEDIGLSDCWNCQTSRLRVFFEATTDQERAALRRDLRVAETNLPGYGEFQALTVPGVGLEPFNHDEARRWAEWRLLKSVQAAPTEARLDKWWRKASKGFGGLRRRSRPELARLAADLDRGRAAALLQAAEDWQLD